MLQKLKNIIWLGQSRKHPVTIVTAYYNTGPESIIGGRGWDILYYFSNIGALCALNTPLVIYTRRAEAAELKAAFKWYRFKKYKLVLQELEAFEYSESLYRIKEEMYAGDGYQENGSMNDRCHHICWQKMLWLHRQAGINTFSSQYFLWIDIGLFHHALFPESHGGTERCIKYGSEKYYPLNRNTLFCPALIDGIKNDLARYGRLMIARRPLDMASNELPDGGEPDIRYNLNIVGGLFGGNAQYITEWHQAYCEILHNYAEKGILATEEDILTTMYRNGILSVPLKLFSNWNHSVEEDPCYMPAEQGQYAFWEIFRNWYNSANNQSL